MENVKKLINCFIPVSVCNLRCQYCYVMQEVGRRKNLMPHFEHDAEYIAKALSVKRLGGVCVFNLCGDGETLLPPEVPSIIAALLKEGHYLEVVTNGTLSNRFDEILSNSYELLQRLEFKFSFHYLELLRTNLLDEFFNNVRKVKDAGCSFTLELMPHDELIPYIEEIKRICLEKTGALCHLTVPRNDASEHIDILSKYSLSDFKEIWESFDSSMLNFKLSTFYIQRKEYCYAGSWSLFVNLATGKANQCYVSRLQQNIYKDIDTPIQFRPVGKHCSLPHCYNSHAMLTLGLIPCFKAPTYAEIRNRICEDGTEWLTPAMKQFLSGKLYENNKELTAPEKLINEIAIYNTAFQRRLRKVFLRKRA